MNDRNALFEAVRAFAPDRRLSPPLVSAIDAVGDLLAYPRLTGAAVPLPFPLSAVDASLLAIVAPTLSADARASWAAAIAQAAAREEINTIRRISAFLAQMGVESQGFTRMGEGLNYSVDGLLNTFGRHRISDADARRLGRNPNEQRLPEERQRQIANLIYGGEWGRVNLGNTQPDDGWVFRGGGPPQVTGRDNWTRYAKARDLSLTDALAYGRTLEGGIDLAAWFWEANDINRLADTPGVADETKKINGGANGLAERTRLFDLLVAELLRRERGS